MLYSLLTDIPVKLLTDIPVERTVGIICYNVHNNNELTPLPFQRPIMEELLCAYTMRVPFRNINCSLYCRADCVEMNLPLVVAFANFYIYHAEYVIPNLLNSPLIYCRHIDDHYVVANNENKLCSIKKVMNNFSHLKFSLECSLNNKLPFLDVNV